MSPPATTTQIIHHQPEAPAGGCSPAPPLPLSRKPINPCLSTYPARVSLISNCSARARHSVAEAATGASAAVSGIFPTFASGKDVTGEVFARAAGSGTAVSSSGTTVATDSGVGVSSTDSTVGTDSGAEVFSTDSTVDAGSVASGAPGSTWAKATGASFIWSQGACANHSGIEDSPAACSAATVTGMVTACLLGWAQVLSLHA